MYSIIDDDYTNLEEIVRLTNRIRRQFVHFALLCTENEVHIVRTIVPLPLAEPRIFGGSFTFEKRLQVSLVLEKEDIRLRVTSGCCLLGVA